MRIFITGATGYIGGAVARELRERDHEVAALARPDAETRHLRDAGVVIVSGDLGDLPSLRETLDGYDAFIHTAQARGEAMVARDRDAVDAFTAHDAFFLYTSGVWAFGNTGDRVVDETTEPFPLPISAWRTPHEQLVLRGGKHAVIRPGCVYGGKQSLLADWFAAADQERPLRIIGDGANRWAMVNLGELADLYARIVEARAAGVFHGIDDTSESLETCARLLSENIEKTPADEAREQLGPFADALLVDQQIGSARTRDALGWTPRVTFTNSIDAQWMEWRKATRA